MNSILSSWLVLEIYQTHHNLYKVSMLLYF